MERITPLLREKHYAGSGGMTSKMQGSFLKVFVVMSVIQNKFDTLFKVVLVTRSEETAKEAVEAANKKELEMRFYQAYFLQD